MSGLQTNPDELNTALLNDQDKTELRTFLSNEQQRAQIQSRKKPLALFQNAPFS